MAGQEIAYKGICEAELQSNKTTPPFLPGQNTNTPSSGGSSGGGYSQPINGQTCPAISSPAPGFCQGGKIISGEKNEMGCPLPPKCIMDTTSSNQGAGTVGIPAVTQTQPVVPSADTSQGSSSWQNNEAQVQDVKTPTPQLPPPPPSP